MRFLVTIFSLAMGFTLGLIASFLTVPGAIVAGICLADPSATVVQAVARYLGFMSGIVVLLVLEFGLAYPMAWGSLAAGTVAFWSYILFEWGRQAGRMPAASLHRFQ